MKTSPGKWQLFFFILLNICSVCYCIKSGRGELMENNVWKVQDMTNITCAQNSYPPLNSSERVPKYIINLDLPPEERWNELMADKKENALNLLKVIKNYTESFFKGRLFKFVDKYLPYMAKTLPQPYLAELQGIAQATDIALGEITLYNIFYEVFTFCTSIIAEGADGHLYHGRNLDFGLFLGWDVTNHTWLATEALRDLVVELDFQRSGKTVYKSVNFAGYIGVLTGMKPQRFTLSLDERFNIDGGFVGIIRWLLGDHSAKWAGFLMRDILEKADGYPEALNALTTTKLLAPVYFILGGNSTGQGAIITRGRHDADVWFLGRGSVSQLSTWFLVQTNYDHWNKPPFFDNRRDPAIHCLDKMGRHNTSRAGLYDVLSTIPVLNQLTTYTTVMDVKAGAFDTWLRYCPSPCFPW